MFCARPKDPDPVFLDPDPVCRKDPDLDPQQLCLASKTDLTSQFEVGALCFHLHTCKPL